jgi:hypothetical protein
MLILPLLLHQEEHEDGCSDSSQAQYATDHASGDCSSVG